jgi:uncharacterized protein YjbI with pentapeptide repeats
MANAEHLRILKRGGAAWKKWRDTNRQARPDLSGAKLSRAKLSRAELNSANLRGADLICAHLSGAKLRDADLSDADLGYAFLNLADFRGARLIRANLNQADLSGAKLVHANLNQADLSGAVLNGADLRGADLNDADLSDADLSRANLSCAELGGAELWGANLSGADLGGAELGDAVFFTTTFADVDLSEAKGLDLARHWGPSTLGLDTLYKSHGRIPDRFLRDAGVPEDVIEHLLPLIRNSPPIQWHSCFISYSTKDEGFARRLHSRMRQANMRVWFAPEDLAGGKKLHEQLFGAIQLQDKLLLVLSAHSIRSEWVMTEIRKAREVEKRENRRKLFPIRLVDFDALRAWTCFDADSGKDLSVEVREYFIPDFSCWKEHDAFEAAFKKLQADLKTGQFQPTSL